MNTGAVNSRTSGDPMIVRKAAHASETSTRPKLRLFSCDATGQV